MRIFISMDRKRHPDEHDGEHREDEGLNRADEDFEKHEWERDDVWHEKRHDGEEHFAREYVPEKTERQRDYLSKFRDEFKYADEEIDGSVEIEKHAEALPKPDRDRARHIHERDRDHGKRKREVQIARGRTEELRRLPSFIHDNRSDARQKPQPVREQNKNENRENEREIFFGCFPVAEHGIHNAKRAFDDHFSNVLHGPRNHRKFTAQKHGDNDKQNQNEHAHEERVRYRKTGNFEEGFSPERNL